jgi:hypothetical protein
VEQGYTVRACVRDVAIEAKTAHLLALNGADHRGADQGLIFPISDCHFTVQLNQFIALYQVFYHTQLRCFSKVTIGCIPLQGAVELYEADLNDPGSYDAAFAGAVGVVHTGAAVGFNRETPQQV